MKVAILGRNFRKRTRPKMKIINVNSLPLKDVIRDLAKAFDTQVHNQCDEYWVHIPDTMGEGVIRGINFPGGLGIIQYECQFCQNVELQFSVNLVHPLKFIYCLEGEVKHRFENEKEYQSIQMYQSAVVASSSFNGHVLQFETGKAIKINSLELDRKVFKPHIECEMEFLDEPFRHLFEDIEATDKFFHEGNYSLQMADLFHEMRSFEQGDFERKIYLQGKSYLMLALQVIQFQDDVQDAGTQSLLRRSDLNQIEAAAKYIQTNIQDLDTIDKIGQKVGLNLNKMQIGFQHLYQMTVNTYIQNVRMERAKTLLEDSEYNISEIVDKIGLSSKSYFSKIFRDTYQMSPSEYKRRYKNFLVNGRS